MLRTKPSPQPAIRKAITRTVRWPWIDFLVWQDDGLLPPDPSHPTAQVADEFVERGELGLCGRLAIQVTDKANSDCDIIEVVARNVAAVNMPCPARTDFYLAVAGGTAVADHKVIGEAVLHPADPAMIPIENAGISLPGATVMNNDILPPAFPDLCLIDGPAYRGRKITPPPEPAASGFWRGFKALIFLQPRLLDQDGRVEPFAARCHAPGSLRGCWGR